MKRGTGGRFEKEIDEETREKMRDMRRQKKTILEIMCAFGVSEKRTRAIVGDIIPGGLRAKQADDDAIWDLKQRGLTNLEIATRMGISDYTIWAACNRIRKRLEQREEETA